MPAWVVAAIAWPSASKVIHRSPEGALRSSDSSMKRRASTSTPTRARALPRSSRTIVDTVATGRPSALSPCFQARSPAGVEPTEIAGRGAASREVAGGWGAWLARVTRAAAPDAVSTDRERITARRSSVRSRTGRTEWIRERSSRAADPDASSESRNADDPAGRPTIVNCACGIRAGERPTVGSARARAALVESATARAVSSTRRARRSIHSARYRASS